MDIATAWREIEVAGEMLETLKKARKEQAVPDIRDAFGRLRGGLQLGVPSGSNGHRLYDVPWSLAETVIERTSHTTALAFRRSR
ncbi:hypothetical protein [Rhodobacteraceae bacterium DSL-40]|uniref:hypothetical protein n=1 Tax=Amaricoccus sp. B4 TaxID=3368557 RepID=UPI000DAC85B8